VLEEVEMVRVEAPAPAIEAGVNAAVVLAGKPLTLSPTVPLKPLIAVVDKLNVVEFPAVTVCDDGAAESPKSVTCSVRLPV
jgi:hypothetical protein